MAASWLSARRRSEKALMHRDRTNGATSTLKMNRQWMGLSAVKRGNIW
jgi:hypothetical protein